MAGLLPTPTRRGGPITHGQGPRNIAVARRSEFGQTGLVAKGRVIPLGRLFGPGYRSTPQ